jgi:hypothetical protein
MRLVQRANGWMRLSLSLSWMLVACHGNTGRPHRNDGVAVGAAKVGGAIVSTVNGEAIGLDEVKATAESLGITLPDALRRLQSEHLLMLEAQRAGYMDNREVERVERQANVQALLEAEAHSVVVTEADLAEAYAKQAARFHVPETRTSSHVLVKVAVSASPDEDARAKEVALQLRDAFQRRPDVQAWQKRFRKTSMGGIPVISEQLPAASRAAALEAAFLSALFALPAVGVPSEPVRTSYGWHIIVMTHQAPAQDVSFESARATLDSELRLSRQRARIDEVIAKKRATTSIAEASTAKAAIDAVQLE